MSEGRHVKNRKNRRYTMPLSMKSRRSTYDSSRNMLHQRRKKKRLTRTFVTIIIFILVFLLAGLAYTWYMGRYMTPLQTTDIPKKVKKAETTSTPVDENAQVGVAEQIFTRTVRQGQNASLQIKTNRLAACSIRVEYNKQESTDTGLMPKKADEYGVVSWAWTVEDTRPVGRWPVTVTCANATKSGVHVVYLTVEPK